MYKCDKRLYLLAQLLPGSLNSSRHSLVVFITEMDYPSLANKMSSIFFFLDG